MAKKKRKKMTKQTRKKPVSRGAKRKPSAAKKTRAKKASKAAAKKGPAKRKAESAQTPTQPRPAVGSFIWHELATTDAARCTSFYSQLFGWKSADQEMMPGFVYTTFAHRGQDIAGMMQISPDQTADRPHWNLYVLVRDVDAAAALCESLGGEVTIPPHDIPVGRWSMLKDPTGAMIAIFKPAQKPRAR